MAKYTSPLNADTVSALTAAPVRLGLQTKLNSLAIGLIVLTALGVAAFLVSKERQDEQGRLMAHGLATAAMLAEVADEGIASRAMSGVTAVLEQFASNAEMAYVAVFDARQRVLLSRSYGDAPVPKEPLNLPAGNEATASERQTADGRYSARRGAA